MAFSQIVAGYGLGQLAIFIVILLALAGLVMVYVRQSGISVPEWLSRVIGIVVAAAVIILAIKIVLSM